MPVGIGSVSFIITEKLTPYVTLFVVSIEAKTGSIYLVCAKVKVVHKKDKINKRLKVIFFISLVLLN